MRDGDLETVLRWRNHPDVRKCMLSQHEITVVEHRSWFYRSLNDDSRALLVVEANDQMIGCVVFSNISCEGTADWSFYVDPVSPPGTGKKVCYCGLEYAFDILKVNSVMGRVLDTNMASIFIHNRLGFKQLKEWSKKNWPDSKNMDVLFFEITRAQFTS